MKLILFTQVKENYAAHNEDYVHGISKTNWKSKGGDILVLLDFTGTAEEAKKELRPFVHVSDEHTQVYFLAGYELLEDDAPTMIESWETPYILRYQEGEWHVTQHYDNEIIEGLKREIKKRTVTFVLGPQGEKKEHKAVYLMVDGSEVTDLDGLVAWLGENQRG